jgi:hypothetical protein
MTFHVPNKFRIATGRMGSTPAFGNNGAFVVRLRHSQLVNVIASDGMGWEHVSVSRTDRCPTWDEMCQIKAMFWSGEDVVIQYHPAESEYVNHHQYCLHLWRPIGVEFPTPPSIMVGWSAPA